MLAIILKFKLMLEIKNCGIVFVNTSIELTHLS